MSCRLLDCVATTVVFVRASATIDDAVDAIRSKSVVGIVGSQLCSPHKLVRPVVGSQNQ